MSANGGSDKHNASGLGARDESVCVNGVDTSLGAPTTVRMALIGGSAGG